jgi:hypothetical protein
MDDFEFRRKLLSEASDEDRPHVVRLLQQLDDAKQQPKKLSLADRLAPIIHEHVIGCIDPIVKHVFGRLEVVEREIAGLKGKTINPVTTRLGKNGKVHIADRQ